MSREGHTPLHEGSRSYDAEKQRKYIQEEYERIIPYFNPNEWYEHRNLILSMHMMIEHLEEKLKTAHG